MVVLRFVATETTENGSQIRPPAFFKVGHCPSCHVDEAGFSKKQWKKKAGLRKCTQCVAAAGVGNSHTMVR